MENQTCCGLSGVNGSNVETWNITSCPSYTVYSECEPVMSSETKAQVNQSHWQCQRRGIWNGMGCHEANAAGTTGTVVCEPKRLFRKPKRMPYWLEFFRLRAKNNDNFSMENKAERYKQFLKI